MGHAAREQQKPWEVCSLGGRRQVVWRLYPLQFPESMPTAMHVHLQLRIVGDDGTVITDSEILHLEKSDHQFEAVGLSISESKTLQKCLQQHVVTAQAAAYVNRHRCCPACGRHLCSKGKYPIVFRTVFGNVTLSSPRGSVAAFREAADWIERHALRRGKRSAHAEQEEPVQGTSVHLGS